MLGGDVTYPADAHRGAPTRVGVPAEAVDTVLIPAPLPPLRRAPPPEETAGDRHSPLGIAALVVGVLAALPPAAFWTLAGLHLLTDNPAFRSLFIAFPARGELFSGFALAALYPSLALACGLLGSGLSRAPRGRAARLAHTLVAFGFAYFILSAIAAMRVG